MEAPVVPMKLAMRLPIRRKIALTFGVPARLPLMRMPPDMTKSEASRMMKET